MAVRGLTGRHVRRLRDMPLEPGAALQEADGPDATPGAVP